MATTMPTSGPAMPSPWCGGLDRCDYSVSDRATSPARSKRSSTSTMLEELYVENLGIIRSARIEPGPGLVAITGETGTGKTLLLGALRLLRGGAARTDPGGTHGDEGRAPGA